VLAAHAVVTDLRTRTPRDETFSAGVVERRQHGLPTPTVLVAAADKAMYRAKRGGRNRVVAATKRDLCGSGRLHTRPSIPTRCSAPIRCCGSEQV
jgi:hypothetical protein